MGPAPKVINWETITDDELVERFAGVTVWRRGDQRAPHKPLLLLVALARLMRGEGRLVSFEAIDGTFRELLKDYGPPRKSYHPEFPFWHLKTDGLWEIPQLPALEADLARRNRRNNPPRNVLVRERAEGGLPPALEARLRSNPALVNRITQRLLDDNWPSTVHQDILDSVGMPWVQVARSKRDPAFRQTVLRIYSHRCAVCGWDGKLGGNDLALEAAHVKWHAAGGADSEDNGIALCTLHHKAFDRGAIGLDEARRILVSQHLHGSSGIDEWILRFAGRAMSAPQPGAAPPSTPNIAWHHREVFFAPARCTP